MSVALLALFLHGGSLSGSPMDLYPLARINRVAFFFLYRLAEKDMLPRALEREYQREHERYVAIGRAFVGVSEVLDECGVDFAVFKSLRPYPSTTVDIDVLVFDGFLDAVSCLVRRGYRILGSGPESMTLAHPGGAVSIDLYREVAVSRVIYLDKEGLRGYATWVETPFGRVRVLRPEADVVAFAAHSVIKEQMFTLADYLTVMGLLRRADPYKVVRVAEMERVTRALFLVFAAVLRVLRAIRENSYLSLPMKFRVPELCLALWERLARQRGSLAYQALYLSRPVRLRKFLSEVLRHATRVSY